MPIKEQSMLIFTDARNNNNKFYEVILFDDDSIQTRWGRVNSEGTKSTSHGGSYEYNKIIRAKMAKGYEKAQTIQIEATIDKSMALKETAKRDLIKSDQKGILQTLIEKLSEMNRHELIKLSGGQISIDDDGLIKTSLGIVNSKTIDDARKILKSIEKFIKKKDFTSDGYITALESYLKLIPQKVPSKRGWYETFFDGFSSFQNQTDFLDQLEGSVSLYEQKKDEIKKKALEKSKDVPAEKVFNTQLELVTDKTIIAEIEKFYQSNINRQHVSSHLKLKNVYVLVNDEEEKKFEQVKTKVGNIRRLWHGTRAFNVLSILKNGLIIPKSTGTYQVNGRMFGDGVYFSDQSTKSLNYSYGYWDGGSRDNHCFMFLADVAMGKEYTPKSYTESLPKKGYDSTFAKAGQSGVMNNEMIVYSLDQIQLKYLCEFSS